MIELFSSFYSLLLVISVLSISTFYWFCMRDSDTPKPYKEDVSEDQEEEDDPNDQRQKMAILFGSQTGTAEEFGNTLASEAKRWGFKGQVVDMVDIDSPEEYLQEQTLVVLMIATYGEGEPTDNARDFYEWLKDDSHPSDLLKNVKYTVFGLGNKQYKIYQGMARYFDKRFEELGATRIFKKGEGDADANIEEDFEEWKSGLLPELSSIFDTNAEQGEEQFEQKYEIKYYPDSTPKAQLPFDIPRSIPDAKTPFLSTVIVNKQLLKNVQDRSSVHVEFSLEGSRISYEAGDHLAVNAENEQHLVDAYADRLGIKEQMNKVFSMLPRKDKSKPSLFPKRCTIATALKFYVDLNGIPRKKLLKGLLSFTKDENEKNEISILTSNTEEGKMKFKEFIKDAGRNTLDILLHFKSVQLPIDAFFELIPRLQPRYYSIASSSQMHAQSVHALVAVVRYETIHGKKKSGVCSSYLERLKSGDKAYIYIRQSTFHLPRDMKKPIIMVGPGTGLAPFVGFLQQRRSALKKEVHLGPCYLFFGCRKKNEDFIYQQELEAAEKDGVISKLVVAFSRDQDKKVYVQHKMMEYKKEIWDVLKSDGVFFVCGDAKYMAKDVDNTLTQIVEQIGGMSKEEAQKFVDKLSSSSRYLRDVWSPS